MTQGSDSGAQSNPIASPPQQAVREETKHRECLIGLKSPRDKNRSAPAAYNPKAVAGHVLMLLRHNVSR